MSAAALFVGADTDSPTPPGGQAGVLLTFFFTSQVQLYRGDVLVDDRPNWDIWIPPPVLLIDGAPARASWSSWFYPLPVGAHQVEIREPAAARQQLDVVVDGVARLRYEAAITIRKDHTDTHVLRWDTSATLGSGS
ncbi:hypothetical protein ACLQ29_18730 [Micromonospora sp. DT228]|uniref:hypothetical protein n=1 Tax=Micromonospora sp. DT228 TaxID=3393443 RepID=UPI003CF58EA6